MLKEYRDAIVLVALCSFGVLRETQVYTCKELFRVTFTSPDKLCIYEPTNCEGGRCRSSIWRDGVNDSLCEFAMNTLGDFIGLFIKDDSVSVVSTTNGRPPVTPGILLANFLLSLITSIRCTSRVTEMAKESLFKVYRHGFYVSFDSAPNKDIFRLLSESILEHIEKDERDGKATQTCREVHVYESILSRLAAEFATMEGILVYKQRWSCQSMLFIWRVIGTDKVSIPLHDVLFDWYGDAEFQSWHSNIVTVKDPEDYEYDIECQIEKWKNGEFALTPKTQRGSPKQGMKQTQIQTGVNEVLDQMQRGTSYDGLQKMSDADFKVRMPIPCLIRVCLFLEPIDLILLSHGRFGSRVCQKQLEIKCVTG